jgi:hypothetical protein
LVPYALRAPAPVNLGVRPPNQPSAAASPRLQRKSAAVNKLESNLVSLVPHGLAGAT